MLLRQMDEENARRYVRAIDHTKATPEDLMSRPEVLAIGSYPPSDMEALEREYQVHRYWEAKDKHQLLRDVAGSVRAIATRGDLSVGRDLMEALPKLEIIACYGVGVDGIDLEAARAHGIKVSNTPDVLTEDVADLAIALMLAVARRIPEGHNHVRSGQWATVPFPVATRMHGKRLGILGMGRIGRAIAKRAKAFGMTISYFSRSRRDELPYAYFQAPEALAAASDFLVAAVIGGASTAGLVNAKVLEALGSGGYFINVARGSVADEEALIRALETHAIAGAGLDVYLNEPKIDPRFLALDNVVLQPHVGSATVETRKAMGQLMRDNLAAHFAGRSLLTPVV
jgi:lactate dehydrogenase-like 2-hydroxyacid dehydrogenase